MDLTFQANQSPNFTKNTSKTDKLRDSIRLSQKRLDYGIKITKKQKQNIIRFITNDFAYNLSKYLEKRAIKLETQVGPEGGGWNVLHFSVKCNALQCIEFALKQFYAQSPEQFEKYINSKTVEGYTPVMIAIINQTNDALSTLLKYGAVDIHTVDNKRMTAYQLAINYKNQQAIKVLMSYENQSRRQKTINKLLLQEPMIFCKREQGFCYRSFMAVFDCLSFGMYTNRAFQEIKTSTASPRRSSILNMDFMSDKVKISRDPRQQTQYDIEWKQVTEIITNQKYPLFQNYNPFDISEKNVVLKNNLILFQCLSQHPWVIRKIVQIDRTKSNFYNINFFMNFQMRKFNINNQIPFLKDRQQTMFIENHNEMWPMLLQKGLAKAHGSYFDLDDIASTQLIEEMTGFPTFQIDVQQMENLQIFALLKEIHNKNYLYLLEGTQGSHLSSQGKKDCFSVLQFFDKGDKKLILVNCPFVDDVWKEKEKYEMHSLKLIKSHFNNHDQMCVWIEADRLKEYFSKIVVSMTLPNYERVTLKAKVKNQFFFTFKVDKKRQEKIMLQLVNLETKKAVNFGQIRAYMNEGSKQVIFNRGVNGEGFAEGVVSTQNEVGEYMCCITLDKPVESQIEEENIAQSLIYSKIDKKAEKFMLVMWSADGIEPKYLDENLGPVQFLHWVQMNSLKFWAESEIYRVQVISDYALIMMKDRDSSSRMYMTLQTNQNDLIQGTLISSDTVQMVRHQDDDPYFNSFYYCVIRNVSKYQFAKKSSYIKDPNNMGPAGETSVGKKLNFFSQ